MSVEGVDYSFARPGGAALEAAGKVFACRYLAYSHAPGPSEAKFLTKPELADLHGHGISVVANFESTSNRALDGWGGGVADGSDAKVAMEGLGFPPDCPVYFAVDFNAQNVDQGKIDQYLKGAASVLGQPRIGVYGSYAVLTRCKGNRTAAWFWQTYAWSSGHVAPWANLYQYSNGQSINGAAVDFDRALSANYGAYDAPGGAGPAQPGGTVYDFSLLPGPAGSLTVKGVGHSYLKLSDGTQHAIPDPAAFGTRKPAYPIKISPPLPPDPKNPGDRATGYLIGTDAAFLLATDVVFTPDSTIDCTAAIAADRAKAHIVWS